VEAITTWAIYFSEKGRGGLVEYQKAVAVNFKYALGQYNLGNVATDRRETSTRPSPLFKRPWRSSPSTPRLTYLAVLDMKKRSSRRTKMLTKRESSLTVVTRNLWSG
jgi:hypothetical protein